MIGLHVRSQISLTLESLPTLGLTALEGAFIRVSGHMTVVTVLIDGREVTSGPFARILRDIADVSEAVVDFEPMLIFEALPAGLAFAYERTVFRVNDRMPAQQILFDTRIPALRVWTAYQVLWSVLFEQ